MSVVINPGTGPVPEATLEHARLNIEAFVNELWLVQFDGDPTASKNAIGEISITRHSREDSDGRFCFRLHFDGHETAIDMPGLPLERVQYEAGTPGQNPFEFPRLYVDGSSWLWSFAVECARDALLGADEDEDEAG